MALKDQMPVIRHFTPALGLSVLAAVGGTLLLRYFLSTEPGELAAHWMQDDAFYYLQPAWLFKSLGFFTFDGVNKTYGFHPLWMLILTLLAHTTTDKVFFLREALILSGFLYFAAGIAIYFLMKRLVRKWIAVIPAGIWMLNTDLQNAFVSGMENSLVALLLVCFLIAYSGWEAKRSSLSGVLFLGFLSGLLFLSRVSMLMVILLLTGTLLYQLKGWRGRILTLSAACAGFAAAVLPWAIYAYHAFGTVFPNSGERKLVGSFAGLVAALQNSLPFLNLHWLAGLLPAHEQLLLTQPSALLLPGISVLLDFLFGYLPARTYSFGLFSYLKSLPPDQRITLRYVFYGVILLWAVIFALAAWKNRRDVKKTLKGLASRMHLPAPLGFLLILAAIDLISLALLLPTWLHTMWYGTAETLACLLLPALILNAVEFKSDSLSRRGRTAAGFALSVVLVGMFFVNAERLSSRPFAAKPEHIDEEWLASSWVNSYVPAGSRIGSWSSGLLGFFVTTSSVTNLDGLANSPEFVREVFIQGKLYALGLAEQNAVWQYVQQKNIRYFADSEFESRLRTHDFFQCIPRDHYTVVYRGSQRIDWHEPEGTRVFTIIRLNY